VPNFTREGRTLREIGGNAMQELYTWLLVVTTVLTIIQKLIEIRQKKRK
jgi:hypothetical protein